MKANVESLPYQKITFSGFFEKMSVSCENDSVFMGTRWQILGFWQNARFSFLPSILLKFTLVFQELWSDSPYSDLINLVEINKADLKGHSQEWTGVFVILLIVLNLTMFICCGMRGGSKDEDARQPLCTPGEPPFDVPCLKRWARHPSTESLTEKVELESTVLWLFNN